MIAVLLELKKLTAVGTIGDSARIYPGDGVAPLASVFNQLRSTGFSGVLSLEMFNNDDWQQDPALVARIGLAKMKSAVAASVK